MIGGFFLRDPYRPLGDLWLDGRTVLHEAIAEPYGARRACVVANDEGVRLLARAEAPSAATGDLERVGR